ncbi:MAG: hypothetical protein E7Z63_03460 [Thermoplasmata archaeon]|nr:hypothetical protein [Thermoplasmata archaeon]
MKMTKEDLDYLQGEQHPLDYFSPEDYEAWQSMFINSWRVKRRKNRPEYDDRAYIDIGGVLDAIEPIVHNVYRLLASYGLHNPEAAKEIVDYCLDTFCPYPLRDLDYEPDDEMNGISAFSDWIIWDLSDKQNPRFKGFRNNLPQTERSMADEDAEQFKTMTREQTIKLIGRLCKRKKTWDGALLVHLSEKDRREMIALAESYRNDPDDTENEGE